MTAKSQIQVHNHFFLKETHKLSETISFLTTMTNIIIARHAARPLNVIPTRYLSRPTYIALQNHLKMIRPSETYHTSFEAYQELNDKSGSKTLREAFARMLFCVKGMSAERVSAVLDEFDTPKALWDAMRRHEEGFVGAVEEESQSKKGKTKTRGKQMFFADRVQGEGRRKVGDALSRDVSQEEIGEPRC
jgi:crossover junction endonuclease MUS81